MNPDGMPMTNDQGEPRIDRRFWFGGPAVVDTGSERLALRRIQIINDTPDQVDIRVSFLNKPAITRKVGETSRSPLSMWILATDGPLYVSEAHDGDFAAFSDLDIPPPPNAIPALVRLMEEAIVEWEGDVTPDPEDPIYWDSEGGAHEELDAVIAYASPGHFLENDPVADVHYIVNQREPIYGARLDEGKWIEIPAAEALDSEAEYVTIARGNERAFLDLFSANTPPPYGLAILASIPRDDAIQIGHLTPGMRKWIGMTIRRTDDPEDFMNWFLEGRAEIEALAVFESVASDWIGKARE